MYKYSQKTFGIQQLAGMIENGQLDLNHLVQRAVVWNRKQQIALIESLLIDFPIPPIYVAKTGNVFSVLNGKQRLSTIAAFINNEFALDNLADTTIDVGGKSAMFTLRGKKFDDLPNELKIYLCSRTITLYVFEDLTDEQLRDAFFRYNTTKALTTTEHLRSLAEDLTTIRELAKHPLIQMATTEKGRTKYNDEDIVLRSYIVLTQDNPSFDKQTMFKLWTATKLTEKDVAELTTTFNRFLTVVNAMKSKKSIKSVLTKTNLISIMPFIKELPFDSEDLAAWLEHFFVGGKEKTISSLYNENSQGRSTDRSTIAKRHQALHKDCQTYFKLSSIK